MGEVSTIGLDIAKSVFQVGLSPCLVGIEALKRRDCVSRL